jgi:hypothetical protein
VLTEVLHSAFIRRRGHAGGDLRDETSLPSVAYTNRGPQPRVLARSMRREASVNAHRADTPTDDSGIQKGEEKSEEVKSPAGGRDQIAISEFRRLERL